MRVQIVFLCLWVLIGLAPAPAQSVSQYRAFWVDTFNTTLNNHNDVVVVVNNARSQCKRDLRAGAAARRLMVLYSNFHSMDEYGQIVYSIRPEIVRLREATRPFLPNGVVLI